MKPTKIVPMRDVVARLERAARAVRRAERYLVRREQKLDAAYRKASRDFDRATKRGDDDARNCALGDMELAVDRLAEVRPVLAILHPAAVAIAASLPGEE